MGTPNATAKITSSAGRPRNSSTYDVAIHRYGATGESFIRATTTATARPMTKVIAVYSSVFTTPVTIRSCQFSLRPEPQKFVLTLVQSTAKPMTTKTRINRR